jgi:hypothetical protein
MPRQKGIHTPLHSLLKKQRAKFGGKLDGKVGTEMRKRGCCSDFGFKIFNFFKKKRKRKNIKTEMALST